MLDAWKIYSGRSDITAIVHVGLTRSTYESYEELANRYPGKVLLTASAKWVFLKLCKTSRLPADIIDATPVYVATDGWGYVIADEELGLAGELEPPPSIHNGERVRSSNWLNDLNEKNLTLYNAVRSAGITDDSSYWERERLLPYHSRVEAGRYRFQFLTKQKSFSEPTEILKFSPPWVFEENIKNIGLTVRSYNALIATGFTTVEDLSGLTTEALLNIPNFGRRSLRDVNERLLQLIFPKDLHSIQPPLVSDFQSSVQPSLDGSESDITVETKPSVAVPNSFNSTLERLISSLDQKISKALHLRMGLNCEAMTLQEVGDAFGFTRERARQLESKGIKQLANNRLWESEVGARLARILDNRSDPVTLAGLGILDPWFAGVEIHREPVDFIFENFLADKFHLVRANGQFFVTKISQEEWDEICRLAAKRLEDGVGKNWSLSEAKQKVEDLLPLRGIELKSELWVIASRFAHFSSAENGETFLVGIGRSAEVLVESVLAESSRPLHFSEIAKQIKEKYGKEVDERRAHNAALDRAFRFGPGTYGLLKHCPVTSDELRVIRERCEEIIFNGSDGRQWSCAELADTLEEDGLDLDGRLSTYVVNIALSQSESLSYLRRMIWTKSTQIPLGATHRLDLAQAVESLLLEAGRPMSASEIKETIQRERGLSDVFQIHQTGSLIRVGIGQWGLIERDLPLSKEDQQHVIDEMEFLLRKRNSGIHVTEIASELSSNLPKANLILDPTVFFTLAQRSGRMRVSPGKYLFLPEWGGARRLSSKQAISTVILQAPPEGLRASEIAQRASDLLGRVISRDAIYSPLFAIGARYDEALSRWFPPEKEGFDTDDDDN
ncbi:MAG TPA: DNA-directed RNA polymerase subunit alpha C-terminal domain-containing protein [Cyclobacteriaceae bacterium]|nr:DNA-directed RNA polymerase subunit alpha C-terminal domain-containing protein [Cyclobacteriaceae bacterium]